ncbi:hypothetical protein HPB48_010213 [Haemaphysalis longicornis]|uniref:Uncharacterized protein n=1 Tax=Haemaphysalis longicornis TaxID=44386 RepID=A0A9J6GDB1_HAELO|nr:hypothetical protein HPB48_010213 [Haemaphysalis longicornis]
MTGFIYCLDIQGFPNSSADGSVVELDDVARCLAVGDSFSGSAHTCELTDSSIEQQKCCKSTCHGSKAEPLPPDKQLDDSTSSASFCESAAEDHEDTSFRPSPDNSMQEYTTELPHAERKFIVFESALLKLFERCAECSQRGKVTTHVQGTLLKITAECGDHYKVWYSQPLVNGMASGNILLCAAIMFGGASTTKVLRLLASVNISVPSKTCYMVYQKGCLAPAIKKVRHREVPLKNGNCMGFVILQAWKAEQADLFVTLKGQELRLLGDGRTQLAILHHNENVVRDQATDASGNPQFHRKLPKSSKGREVLCPVKTKATHKYVHKLVVASMEECALHGYCFMKLRKVSPQPAPMSAAYQRLHIDVLKAKRMLRFKK